MKGQKKAKREKIMAQTISDFGENMSLWALRISEKKYQQWKYKKKTT